ncbi:hypothetical protein [Leptospira perolatii]|nr:hypothetical protein [Leptospira perolatii]
MLLVLILISLASMQCAVFEKRNRILTTYLDTKIQPESTGAKIALAPIVIPIGLVSILLDVFILHPISELPEAADDTYVILWKDPSGGIVQQAFLLIPKLVATPIFFLVDWLGRSGFDF